MKIILAILTIFFITNINAGEFSKIDQEVRETIITKFDVDGEGNFLKQIDYNDDIWNLTVIDSSTEPCFITVSAHFNKPSDEGSVLAIAWVCINKDQNGEYEGKVLEHELLN